MYLPISSWLATTLTTFSPLPSIHATSHPMSIYKREASLRHSLTSLRVSSLGEARASWRAMMKTISSLHSSSTHETSHPMSNYRPDSASSTSSESSRVS
ncbi:hypothetical protein B0F90DRAFT_1754817 [Multifurca ochricompacta]|uniref:Uncharacterized protein n=1 Tax=Multifurca ochricompacta TaxID=376703 RepID=A0AAD4LY67_9AGAM|nr:hypothetical protein B0F90DRAFT_1754817 [Multifurca ochricompacta]